jgi:GNAT superfamily N-acetyltransferase
MRSRSAKVEESISNQARDEQVSFLMKVRPARSADAQRCAEISSIRSAEELRKLLDQPDVRWLVIESDAGIVVGIGIIHFWVWNKVAWVWDLTIAEKERGKGYGRNLLKGMIEAARKMGARVLMDFEFAKGSQLADLYLKSGFRICGTNDRWFACDKDSTAVFYGYDL